MQKEIRISQVLECLDKGMSREEIASHFEISKVDCKQLFLHPKLKGLKMKKQPLFTLTDDTEDVVTEEVGSINLVKTVASVFNADVDTQEEQN